MTQLALYELGGPDGQRYSLFSWRTRFALAHKGLTFRSVPVGISDKASIAFSGQTKVPILVDGDKVICDSWSIAEHLEDTFADRASLFGGDTGRGLAPGDLEAIFTPFARGAQAKTADAAGLGLGLPIARRIAERHGGAIDARNLPDGGARFSIRLPLLRS